MSATDWRPATSVSRDRGPFTQVDDQRDLGRREGPHFLAIAESASTPPPKPLFRESELPEAVVREHRDWVAPPPVNIYAVRGMVVGGGGLAARDGVIWLPQDCYPHYVARILERDMSPVWAGSLITKAPKLVEIDGPCAIPLNPNTIYGHFLLEMAPRMYALKVLARQGHKFRVLIDSHVAPFVKTFVKTYLSDLEIFWYDGKNEIISPEILYIPGMMHEKYFLHPMMNDMVDDILATFGAPAGAAGSRVYLSKAKKGDSWHMLTNAEEVETVFADLGFSIVHPETLPFAEQFAIYRGASCLAGEYGSALHNALFAPRGAAVISLNRINNFQSMIARLRGGEMAYLPPSDGEFRDWRRIAPNWRAQPDKIVRFDMDRAKLRADIEDFLQKA